MFKLGNEVRLVSEHRFLKMGVTYRVDAVSDGYIGFEGVNYGCVWDPKNFRLVRNPYRLDIIIRRRCEGKTYEQIGTELGISKQRVAQLCTAKRLTTCESCGKSLSGRRFCNGKCREKSFVKHCACGARITRQAKHCISCDRIPKRKVDPDVVRKLYLGGVSGPNIARYFGVTPRVVYLALKGIELHWKKLPVGQEDLINDLLR